MKIAIIALGPSHKTMPALDDPEWELWGMPWGEFLADVYFDPHTQEKQIGYHGDKYIRKIERIKEPIYMQQHYDNIPASVEYPLQEMIDIFGDYFQSTPAYMLAMAITKQPETIGIWGLDMTTKHYPECKPNIEYMIGYARAKGIEIVIPDDSPLLKYKPHWPEYTERYGYE